MSKDEQRETDDADHPGRPRGKDEIDPELVKLRRKRTKAPPIMCGTIVLFCAFLMFKLWGDLSFSRKGEQPRSVDSISSLGGDDLEDFISVPARPDRTSSARVFTSKADDGYRISPVFGSHDSMWLMIAGSPWDTEIGYTETYAGRLARLGSMPFYDVLVDHYRSQLPPPRFVGVDAFRGAVESKATSFDDPAGDPMAVTSSTPVRIETIVPGVAEVTAFSTDDYPDQASWTAVLVRLGILDYTSSDPISFTEQTWTYRAPTGDVEGLRAKLANEKLFAARVEEVRKSYDTTWGELAAESGRLRVSGDQQLTWDEIEDVSLAVPRVVSSDAYVLLTNEHPETYWYMTPLFVLLGLFAALFVWALARSVLPEKAAAGA